MPTVGEGAVTLHLYLLLFNVRLTDKSRNLIYLELICIRTISFRFHPHTVFRASVRGEPVLTSTACLDKSRNAYHNSQFTGCWVSRFFLDIFLCLLSSQQLKLFEYVQLKYAINNLKAAASNSCYPANAI